MGLFSKPKDVRVLELKAELNVLEQERLNSINGLKHLASEYAIEPYTHTYLNVLTKANEVYYKSEEIVKRIGDAKLNQIVHYKKTGIADISGINPSLYKTYLILRAELLELRKQKNFLEEKIGIQRNAMTRAHNARLARIAKETEKVLKELMGIKI